MGCFPILSGGAWVMFGAVKNIGVVLCNILTTWCVDYLESVFIFKASRDSLIFVAVDVVYWIIIIEMILH